MAADSQLSRVRPSRRRRPQNARARSAPPRVGLLANAVAGWWWADPVGALGIGGVALYQAGQAWRGESCECCA